MSKAPAATRNSLRASSSASLRVLVFTTVFPNPGMPLHGTFVLERIRRLALLADIEVVAPIPWFRALWNMAPCSPGQCDLDDPPSAVLVRTKAIEEPSADFSVRLDSPSDCPVTQKLRLRSDRFALRLPRWFRGGAFGLVVS